MKSHHLRISYAKNLVKRDSTIQTVSLSLPLPLSLPPSFLFETLSVCLIYITKQQANGLISPRCQLVCEEVISKFPRLLLYLTTNNDCFAIRQKACFLRVLTLAGRRGWLWGPRDHEILGGSSNTRFPRTMAYDNTADVWFVSYTLDISKFIIHGYWSNIHLLSTYILIN